MTLLRRVLRSPAARDFRRTRGYWVVLLVALCLFPAVRFVSAVLVALP